MIQTLKFYNSLKIHISNLTKNIYTKEMRIMNFFADVPQLMKTVRNFLFYSGSGCNTCGTRVFSFMVRYTRYLLGGFGKQFTIIE